MGWSIGSELFWLIAFIISFSVALLYDKSPAFRYRLKFAIYILNVSITAMVIIPIIMFRPFDVRNMLVAIPLIRPINHLLGIRWKISGAEILEKEFPCVVICNHQSMLDILGIVQLFPTMKKCAVIGKKEILYVFPFGIMAWLCGTIFINRKNSSQSQLTITTSAEKIQQNKTKMWIFPEGTRSKKGHVLPFKKGAFHIAMMNKLPIVPVVISPYSFIDDDKKIFDSGTMKIKVLEPIETSNFEYPEDIEKVIHECHEIMDREYQKMLKESQVDRKKHLDSCKLKTSTINGATASCSKDNGTNAIEHAENDIDLHGS